MFVFLFFLHRRVNLVILISTAVVLFVALICFYTFQQERLEREMKIKQMREQLLAEAKERDSLA